MLRILYIRYVPVIPKSTQFSVCQISFTLLREREFSFCQYLIQNMAICLHTFRMFAFHYSSVRKKIGKEVSGREFPTF